MSAFVELLIKCAETHREKRAMYVCGDAENTSFSFGEMLSQIRRIAISIEREGIASGERVALLGENSPRWALAYLGTMFRGSVVVPLDPHGEIETLTNFIENSEAKLAFVSEESIPRFQQIEERLGRKIPAVVLQNRETGNGFYQYDDWIADAITENSHATSSKSEDLALMIYTSGTTGKPKAVPLTHGNIFAEASGVQDVMRLSEKERILSLLPLFHAYAQIANLWIASTIGAEVIYLKELNPTELERAFKECKITTITGVPRLWYMFHKKIFDAVRSQPKPVQIIFKVLLKSNGFLRDHFKINLGHTFFGKVHNGFGGKLRLAISAGSRFDADVARDFHSLGFTILQGYGLSETSGAATATRFEDNKIGSVGTPLNNSEIKIDSPDAEGIGEVLIRGPIVMSGYFKNPEANREAFTPDGWFRSGDLGRIDSDGHLYIVGRKKDVIVLPNGKNVHPEDLEVHYLKCPLLAEICVLGVEDESAQLAGSEKLIAIAVPDFEYLKQNNIANSREAIRWHLDTLGRELPEYQRVREYIVRAEPLPRTATRKIRRFELQKEIVAGGIVNLQPSIEKNFTLSRDDEKLLSTKIGSVVSGIVKSNTKGLELLHPAMNLEIDLGLDSLSRAEVFAALEHAFGTEFEADEAAKALLISDVIALVRTKVGDSEDLKVADTSLNWSNIVRETDEDFPEIRAVLRPQYLFPFFAFVILKIFYLFSKLFMRLEVSGRENLSLVKRPFLVCPNHQSFLDAFVVCSSYSQDTLRNTFHVGASEFFQSALMKQVAKLLNIVPVDPDTQLMRAMKAGAIGLKHGKILNIYPEGERAFDGDLHTFKKGAAILATELDLPIIPVALDGLQNVWARNSWKIRPAKVKILFGKPIYPREIPGAGAMENGTAEVALTRDEVYESVTEHLKTTIHNMLDEMRN